MHYIWIHIFWDFCLSLRLRSYSTTVKTPMTAASWKTSILKLLKTHHFNLGIGNKLHVFIIIKLSCKSGHALFIIIVLSLFRCAQQQYILGNARFDIIHVLNKKNVI